MNTPAQSPAERLRDPRLPWLLLGAALVAVATLLLILQSRLSFAIDEWFFVLGRRDFSFEAFLDPHNEHMAISHVAIYKGLLEIFGLASPRPFQVVSTLMFLTSCSVLYVFMRRRVGGWLALALLLPILVFGPATDNLVWPFQMAFSGSMAAGIGALLALERGDRRGDLFACGLVVLSLSFSSLGIPFAIAAFVHVLSGPDRLRRAWVCGLPIAFFALWWLGFGREGDSWLSLKNILVAPSYMLDGFASSLAGLFGLATPGTEGPLDRLDAGRPLLAIAIGFGAFRLYRLGRVPRWVLVSGSLGISFWLLAATNANLFRLPTSARYQLIGAVFILILATELLRGVRIPRAAIICAFAIAILAAGSNLEVLRQQWVAFRGATEAERGGISAVEIARERVDPEFEIPDAAGFHIYGDAELYLDAADDLGSPAFTPAELVDAPEKARVNADRVLTLVLPLEFKPVAGRPRANGTPPTVITGTGAPAPGDPGCTEVTPDDFGNVAVELAPGGALVRGGSAGLELAARRFGEAFELDLGEVVPNGTVEVTIPTDASSEPWELLLTRVETASVCGLRP
jgi:hypothetical protein